MVLSEDFKGATCELKTYGNDLLGVAVIQSTEGETLDLAPAEPEERLPILQYQMAIKVMVFSAQHGFHIVTGKVFFSTVKLMRITDVGVIQAKERRGYFRMRFGGNAKLYPPGLHEHQLEGYLPMAAEIEDVSLSGIQICTGMALKEGEDYTLDFVLLSKRHYLPVRVMRLSTFKNGKQSYGLAFIGLTERQTDSICSDIFELQRQEVAKKKKAKESGRR